MSGDNMLIEGIMHYQRVDHPRVVAGLDASDGVTKVCASYSHSCALLQDGRVKCWGRNHKTQLGFENTDSDSTSYPAASIAVQGLPLLAVAISCHEYSSCAVLSDDAVWCWGDSRQGQLGPSRPFPHQEGESFFPPARVLFPSLVSFSGASTTPGFSKFAGGADWVCRISATKSLSCWGANDDAQLARGVMTPDGSNVPTVILSDAIDVFAGEEFACAMQDPKLGDTAPTLYCWGDNWAGRAAGGDNSRITAWGTTCSPRQK